MRCWLFSLLTFLAIPCFSQGYISVPINEAALRGRVKQIDEFIARFNMTESWDGGKISNRNDKTLRKKYLTILFDSGKFLDKGKELKRTATEFIDSVASHDYQIHYEDTMWVAEVRCTAKVGSTHERLKLFLHTEKIKKGEYKWVISNVSGTLFNLNDSSAKPSFISPMEHEIGFVGLLTLKTTNKNVASFMDKSFNPDKLSMLAVLLGSNLLKIESIDRVLYHFYMIPNYAFTVERIEKKGSPNTGWLITSLNKLK